MLGFITKKYFNNRITFVGLGNMGYSMADNMIKGGFKVAGFDANKEVENKLITEGGLKYSSLEESVYESDIVLTMLPNFKVVSQVWEKSFKTAKKGTLFIDSSTTSPVDTKELAKLTKDKGFIPVDAPVSGGVMAAKAGTLNFLIGCEKDHFDNVKKVLSPMGKNFFYCGENGMGEVAKIANNLCLGITMVGLSESLALGVKLGIDPKILSDIMSVSTSRCWSIDTYNPIPGMLPNTPSSRDYENGFGMELITKDMKIALECAKSVDLDVELSKDALEHYEKLTGEGLSKKDFSYVYQYILENKKIKK